ncbi:APC membrane recruitment protein 3-like [Protopterus annectens]|uniref:APC membrane recruitment protein 3-like n=1 Tax=Protopterus annectens TaxID=7888 RepID=UPI001CF9A927|nr:APC membrane recruitment protein 3-like [Protopterus annectens]XP_043925941.1 APC membrane recruitment protein 3-like [Protopterus annectens]
MESKKLKNIRKNNLYYLDVQGQSCCSNVSEEENRRVSSAVLSFDAWKTKSHESDGSKQTEVKSTHGSINSTTDENQGFWSSCKFVRKSKTHDCVIGVSKNLSFAPEDKDENLAPIWRSRRLVNSISFSGLGSPSKSKGLAEGAAIPDCGGKIIDYRNFVPQEPFVPAVAKSIPRKRISIRGSRKAFKDLFNVKSNKHDQMVSFAKKDTFDLSTDCNDDATMKTAKCILRMEEAFGGDSLAGQDLSDGEFTTDISYEHVVSALWDDVASLTSFDSLTGCGEIFADEESHKLLEMERSKGPEKEDPECKPSPVLASFQGGVEQLASPAQTDEIEFTKLWENIKNCVKNHVTLLPETRSNAAKVSSGNIIKAKNSLKGSPGSLEIVPETINHISIDKETAKPVHQESASNSDEGYCEPITPGQDDSVTESLVPALSAKFPRDTYSGDALYELFYDPEDSSPSPGLEEEQSISESILRQPFEIPLSMYSFHIGAEENMASDSSPGSVDQELMQSRQTGEDCALKLCDTEFSLAMEIVNCLTEESEKKEVVYNANAKIPAQQLIDLRATLTSSLCKKCPVKSLCALNSAGQVCHLANSVNEQTLAQECERLLHINSDEVIQGQCDISQRDILNEHSEDDDVKLLSHAVQCNLTVSHGEESALVDDCSMFGSAKMILDLQQITTLKG